MRGTGDCGAGSIWPLAGATGAAGSAGVAVAAGIAGAAGAAGVACAAGSAGVAGVVGLGEPHADRLLTPEQATTTNMKLISPAAQKELPKPAGTTRLTETLPKGKC